MAKTNITEVVNSLVESAQNSQEIANFAILPLENNVEGFVNEALDYLGSNVNFEIVDLIWQEVQFDAVYLQGSDITTLKTINAHPHALAQCREFITQNGFAPVPTNSNSGAVMQLKPGELALAPHQAITEGIFGDEITVYQTNVQDYDDAKTAFAVVKINHYGGKVSLECAQNSNNTRSFWQITPTHEDRPGTLLRILNVINDQNINISSLNSRPLKGVLRMYAFYVILEVDYTTSNAVISGLPADEFHVRYLGGWNE